MTKKQDLLTEAKKLKIDVEKKDTIAVLCKKISEKGVQSKNCPSPVPRKRGRPAKNSPKKVTSPKPKKVVSKTSVAKKVSPKTVKTPVKIVKSPKPETKPKVQKMQKNSATPEKKRSASPLRTVEDKEVIIQFPNKNGRSVRLIIESNTNISAKDIYYDLYNAHKLIEFPYILHRGGNKIDIDAKDHRGRHYHIKEEDLSEYLK